MPHDDQTSEAVGTKVEQFPCERCGAMLRFSPGQQALTCDYCGHSNIVDIDENLLIVEHSFDEAIRQGLHIDEEELGTTMKCQACAAEVERHATITAMDCPFCDHPMVVDDASTKRIRPESLVPFAIEREQAKRYFKGWLHKRWFLPSVLKRRADTEKFYGVYLPNWTYDSYVETRYKGSRGEHYYVNETYTTTDSEGKTVTKTRRVQKTRWWPASGTVHNSFNDILVNASRSLPQSLRSKLIGYNLSQLVPFNESYLSGFYAEVYQLGLPEGFTVAQRIMEPTIRSTIRRDIGGDEQRISWMDPRHYDVTFKHLLLPAWISSFAYKDKVYRFVVNGQTGVVHGERPYSWIKITLFVLMILAIVGLLAGSFMAFAQG